MSNEQVATTDPSKFQLFWFWFKRKFSWSWLSVPALLLFWVIVVGILDASNSIAKKGEPSTEGIEKVLRVFAAWVTFNYDEKYSEGPEVIPQFWGVYGEAKILFTPQAENQAEINEAIAFNKKMLEAIAFNKNNPKELHKTIDKEYPKKIPKATMPAKIKFDQMKLGSSEEPLRQSIWSLGSLGPHIWQSFKEVTVGFGFAFIVALFLGFMAGFYQGFREFITPLNGIFMSIPAIAWAPMLSMIFENQFLAIILVVYIAAVSPMIIAIMEGVLTITGQEVRAARALGAKRNQLFVYVYLPASLPFITAGMRIGFSQAWRALVAAEMVGGIGRGLGHMVDLTYQLGDGKAMMVGIVMIGALSYIFERLIFRRIERHYEVWRIR